MPCGVRRRSAHRPVFRYACPRFELSLRANRRHKTVSVATSTRPMGTDTDQLESWPRALARNGVRRFERPGQSEPDKLAGCGGVAQRIPRSSTPTFGQRGGRGEFVLAFTSTYCRVH